ncbi:uncharacterized protein LOC128966509 [Oppia nitens]|uniref:uncharacterized protein LOC128966509 n=1 Tax=Oppia nitens TaxID=1686743 RepID=UPI0023DBD7B7|nr:uncharacterized protein LOC128966509 [Oppia nitens]
MYLQFIFYNTFYLLCILWCVHETKSSSPPFVALSVNIMAFICDVILIGILWDDHYYGYRTRFVISLIATLVNLFLRILTSIIIYRILLKRKQLENSVYDMTSVTRDLTNYLNISPKTTTTTTSVTQIQQMSSNNTQRTIEISGD